MPSPPSEIDAVLPLVRADLDRAQLLLDSLKRYASGLGTLFVVVPEHEKQAIHASISSQPGLRIELLSEQEVAPELQHLAGVRGWHKQQLVKLAIVDHLHTDFYLTFDADVIATRAFSPELLCPDGKAPCCILHERSHQDWYRDAARMLERPLHRQDILHNVTPVVMAREGVRALSEHFELRYQRGQWASGLRAVRQRFEKLRLRGTPGLAGWRLFLASGLPWTEYALYYSFLEAYELFDRWHEEVPFPIYDVDRSLWKADAPGFARWSPGPLFSGEGPPFFAVLQSNTQIPPAEIREKLRDYL